MYQPLHQPVLRPADVVVALQLALTPKVLLRELATSTLVSIAEAHGAVRRLEAGALLAPGERLAPPDVLLPFLRYGVPHAFPPVLGPVTIGVRTAYLTDAAPTDVNEVRTDVNEVRTEYVWPTPAGSWRGTSLVPLHRRAVALAERNPSLARLLALVDVLRIGSTRARQAADAELRRLLQAATS